ncbi:unnamed protein product [Amoebophrya sp. A120]|nr:unnamed protein product [Amoebophrya sp. A120]|eukprot:GSA120T00014384001.1
MREHCCEIRHLRCLLKLNGNRLSMKTRQECGCDHDLPFCNFYRCLTLFRSKIKKHKCMKKI